MATLSTPFFPSQDTALKVAKQFGTPVYLYDLASLQQSAEAALAFPHAYGLTVRYAMKACPNANLLRIFRDLGIAIDASTGHEVRRAIAAGIAPNRISLSSQELPDDFSELVEQGIAINACSLAQLDHYGQAFPGTAIGLRFNPGAGSGGNNRTNVGGPSSSFGIWHEALDEVQQCLARHRLEAVRLHTHIGSGSDPEVWLKVSTLSLDLVRHFPSVKTLNLGGGYKVGRMPGESTTDLQSIGQPVADKFRAFATETGRQIHLEIEPGTYLVANAAVLLSRIQDRVSTGSNGYEFLKLDAGMTEVLRPSLYGAQHPMRIFSSHPSSREGEFIVVGHCCESGDILTPAPGDPELLAPRKLPEAKVGDLLGVGGVGAYCAAMTTKHYNSFPEAPEVLLDTQGQAHLIRRRQPLEQIWQNEVAWAPQ